MSQETNQAKFKAAYPFCDDVLKLPVLNIDDASVWYRENFALVEVERPEGTADTVIMERDGSRIGFQVNGEDPTQDGAAILVEGICALRDEFSERGLEIGNWRVDERDGTKFQVFFITAPDGLCYYFHEPIDKS